MSEEGNPFAEANVKRLQENFLKQNPYAAKALKAYVDTPSREPTNPVYLALMAIAFELYARAESL